MTSDKLEKEIIVQIKRLEHLKEWQEGSGNIWLRAFQYQKEFILSEKEGTEIIDYLYLKIKNDLNQLKKEFENL